MKKIKKCKRRNGYPKWAKYKATDENGKTYLYPHKPFILEGICGIWFLGPQEECMFLENTGKNPNWRDTLRKIKD